MLAPLRGNASGALQVGDRPDRARDASSPCPAISMPHQRYATGSAELLLCAGQALRPMPRLASEYLATVPFEMLRLRPPVAVLRLADRLAVVGPFAPRGCPGVSAEPSRRAITELFLDARFAAH